jgi:hypothetical protein
MLLYLKDDEMKYNAVGGTCSTHWAARNMHRIEYAERREEVIWKAWLEFEDCINFDLKEIMSGNVFWI